ncbi:MAG: putative membrane protein YeiH, partial [Candidatus Azotimanducaceae bacterium]
GLAVFAILGCVSALKAGSTPIIAIVMGTITACAGGLIRDIVCNDTPLLLKDEIYATAALLGAIIYVTALDWAPVSEFAAPLGITTAFAARLIAIQWHITLPKSSKP